MHRHTWEAVWRQRIYTLGVIRRTSPPRSAAYYKAEEEHEKQAYVCDGQVAAEEKSSY